MIKVYKLDRPLENVQEAICIDCKYFNLQDGEGCECMGMLAGYNQSEDILLRIDFISGKEDLICKKYKFKDEEFDDPNQLYLNIY